MSKQLKWNEDSLFKIIKFMDINHFAERIKSAEAKDNKVEINKQYPLFKDLFGVKIEFGSIRLVRIIIKDAVELLNNFVILSKKGNKNYDFKPLNHIGNVIKTAEFFQLEKPDLSAVQGYVLNNELVEIQRGEFDIIKIKYKDQPENIFYIYKLYFTLFNEELFLVIEKNI